MKKASKTALAWLLAVICVLLTACGGDAGSTTDASSAVEQTTVAETQAAVEDTDDADTTSPDTTVVTTKPGTAMRVRWNKGYVGSSLNKDGFANAINPDDDTYLYTDVMTVERKGTKIVFIDEKNGVAGEDTYVVSSWKQGSDGNWTIDFTRTNAPGNSEYIITSENGNTVYTYISKYDNEYIRLCFKSNDESNKPVVYSSKTNATSTADKITKEVLASWLEEDKERMYYDILKGKTFTVIGDSYLAGNGLDKSLVWPALLASKYDMTYKNYGKNGSTMSNYVTTENPMVSRYSSMADNSPDIVIIEGGRNDYNKSVPIGENGSLDTKTMKGAARYLMTEIGKKYPDALIICMTVWEVGGATNKIGCYCSDYGKALLEVCEDMNIPCINAMDQKATGVYMTEAAFRAKYCMKPTDISHLNAEGMQLVFPYFEKFIAEAYSSGK